MTKDLESLLREDAAGFRPDEGFTRRVMAALPLRRAPAWVRPALVMGSAIAGSAIALSLAPRESSLTLSVAEYLTSGVVSQAMITSLVIGAVLLVSAVVLALDSE